MTSINPSSSTSSNSSSLLRLSGMSSGIDTDAVVKQMVASYQSKIDKENQSKQILQWKQEAYRDIIKDIKGLQDYFDPLSSKYILSANAYNINSSSSGNASIATATATSSANAGTYTIKVDQLAEQAKISGSSINNSMIKVSATDASKWSQATLNFDGKSIQLDSISDTNSNGTTLDDVVANINSKIAANPDLNGKVSASYVNDGSGSYIKFTTSNAISLTATTASGTTGDLASTTINSSLSANSTIGSNISFDLSYDSATSATPIKITASSTDTFQTLMNKVNSATNGAVTMSLDDITGKVTFQSKGYGSSSNITIKNGAGLSSLGISNGTTTGKDAIVEITAPGQATVTTTQSSNNFTSNGVNYNIVNVGTTTATVTSNTDTVVNNMKNFIADYNKIISEINTKLTEKKDKDYPPLTDAQKESMSESQIKTWEDKAKTGILRNDDYLSQLMTQVRGVFSSAVYSGYDSSDKSAGKVSLSFGTYGSNAIGIDTSKDYTDGGQLVITNETKLRSAITNNLDDFKKLFTNISTTTRDTTKSYPGSKTYMEDGIFKRLDNILRDYVAAPGVGKDGTYSMTGSMNILANRQFDYSSTGTGSSGNNVDTFPDQIYRETLAVSKLKTQMSDAETRYYSKFTALETALNKLNAQQSSLASMLGSN